MFSDSIAGLIEPRHEKAAFCICKNKDADQLRGNREADQRLCFRYTDSTIPLLPKSRNLAIFCSCTARFVSDLVETPEDRFSHNEAQLGSVAEQTGLCLIWSKFPRRNEVADSQNKSNNKIPCTHREDADHTKFYGFCLVSPV